MATYNGSAHIQAQLGSLAAQEHLPAQLVVCDDGSTDDTLTLIEEFSRTSPFPVEVHRNPHRLGYADNFLKAARLCKGEWIAFCDQDDVWLPNRLADAALAINQNQNALLILQNALLCQEDLSHDGRLFPNLMGSGYYPPHSQYGFWVWLGFLQTIRADMLQLHGSDRRPRNYYPGRAIMSHDKWTCLVANATGGIVVVARPAALYRRHESALTGQYAKQGLGERIAKALPVGGEHYIFLSDVASETAAYLRAIAQHVDDATARDLDRSAEVFELLAQIQLNRSSIYAGRLGARVQSFVRILRSGGYFGPPMTAMGWRSAVKDFLAVCGLLGGRKG